MTVNNQQFVSNLVAKSMTEFFDQKSPILNTANRDFDEMFNQTEYATEANINVKIPGYQAVQKGLAITPQSVVDRVIPFQMTSDNDLYSIADQFDVFEQKFNILGGDAAINGDNQKAIVDNYAKPTFLALEGQLEIAAGVRMGNTAYLTPIDNPENLGSIDSYASLSQVSAMMASMKFPMDGRVGMANPIDANKVANSLQNTFQPALNKKITESAFVGGSSESGRIATFDFYQTPDLSPHTAGAAYAYQQAGHAMAIHAVAADGVTLTINGLQSVSTQLFNAGDLISIPSVNVIDPVTKVVRQWGLVVTVSANANGNGDGTATVVISEPLIASGMNANVSALPATDAPAVMYASHNKNFFYVPSGLSACAVRLGDIKGAVNSDVKLKNARSVPVKCNIQGNISAYNNIFRTSIFCGIKPFAPYIIVLPSAITA